jgi:hypothetical protein
MPVPTRELNHSVGMACSGYRSSCMRGVFRGAIARGAKSTGRSLNDDRPICALLRRLQDLRWELEAFELSRRGAFGVEVIHLFQSQTFGLWHDEEQPDCRQDRSGAPYEALRIVSTVPRSQRIW